MLQSCAILILYSGQPQELGFRATGTVLGHGQSLASVHLHI